MGIEDVSLVWQSFASTDPERMRSAPRLRFHVFAVPFRSLAILESFVSELDEERIEPLPFTKRSFERGLPIRPCREY